MLNVIHRQHLLEDGWTPAEIDQAIKDYGIQSVSLREAIALLGYSNNVTSGMWFPFGNGFGQLRLDSPGPGIPKYLSPRKGKAKPCVWLPKGCRLSDLAAITEGWKDAFLATIRGGKPVGAIAGVTHVSSVLPRGLGITLVFDSDGLRNANVAQALIKGGLHLKGKIVLIPEEAGDKAGFTEFFGSGYGQSEFKDLLANSRSPRQFFIEWLNHLSQSLLPKHCETLVQLYKKLWRLTWYLDRYDLELDARVQSFCLAHSKKNGAKLNKPELKSIRDLALKALQEIENQQQLSARKPKPGNALAGPWSITNCFDGALSLNNGGVSIPPAGQLAALMEAHWGNRLKYRLDVSGFYAYKQGRWKRVSDREVKELVQRELDAAGAAGEYGQAVVDSTVNLFSQRVSVRSWPTPYGLIPFQNGVLRLADNTLLDHSPAYGFT